MEAVYKGATRPAMKMGIPLVPLVVMLGSAMLVTVWGVTLVSWWLAVVVGLSLVPVFIGMRILTSQDDQRFRQLFLSLKLRLKDRNRRFWRARCYSPFLLRGGSDAWRP